ncbi:MAG: serpin family protein, partial [Candidatus Zixiibacteriota bacterium]
ALVKEVDFQDLATVTMINNWVDENTHGKITKIVDPPIPDGVAVILLNAVYFKGTWTHLFDTSHTYNAEFHLEDGSTTPCRMMTMEDTVAYFSNDVFEAIDLPYGDGSFSMTILLPNENKTVDDILLQLSQENWSTWLDSFLPTIETIFVPRFKFSYNVKLTDVLMAMGMSIAFTPEADLSKMFVSGSGWIDQVIQKTFVQVDEEGTEAAAVTAVVVVTSLDPGFMLDRPFLFVIHEHQTGAVLFMGKIAAPVWND